VDYGNFSEAALSLEVSQSAISHAIAALEEELGVLLLSRGRHGAYLTPVGERVMGHTRQILQLLDGIAKEANLAKGLEGGQVRIASFRSVATHILPKVIAEFHHRFPAIAVSITEHDDYPDVEQALRAGQADVGFIYLPASDEFAAWELFRDEYVALFPSTFEPTSSQLDWEQLTTYPLIMHSENVSCWLRIHAHCSAFGKTLKVAYKVREDSTIVSMVAQGLGAAILPRLAAKPIPAGVQVYSLPVPLVRVIGVAVLAGALQVPATFAFLETLKETDLFTLS
jgi:DNA-binding transcriptional LysR family regulator